MPAKKHGPIRELDFEPHELSGNLNAIGSKGHYWIESHGDGYKLVRVTGDAAGPNTEFLGKYPSEAKAAWIAGIFEEGF